MAATAEWEAVVAMPINKGAHALFSVEGILEMEETELVADSSNTTGSWHGLNYVLTYL